MEYVQQVQARVPADRLGDVRPLFDDLEAHRRELRGLRGFLSMSIGRSAEAGGDTLVNVETRWATGAALDEYLRSSRTAESVLSSHAELLAADSVTTRRLEAEGETIARSHILTERVFTALAVPLVIFGVGLAIIYSLSRVYLEMGSDGATPLAVIVAAGILLVAWYFAQNRSAPVWQMGAIGAVAVALLVGGTVWAQVDDRYPREHAAEGTETPGPDGTPVVDNVIVMDDNVFIFNGENNPTLTAAAGTDVTFDLSNEGGALHNMHIAVDEYDSTICELGGEDPCSDPPQIRSGDSGTITFNLPAGTYEYRCDFHVVEMVGEINVE
jgi:plastocyanin